MRYNKNKARHFGVAPVTLRGSGPLSTRSQLESSRDPSGRGFFFEAISREKGGMNRAIVYVDGFNLYHSLTSPAYKWLDLHKLSASIISSKEALAGVKYFSALCTWDQGKRQRHNNLIRIYRECGVEVILGRFKEVEITCPKRTPMLHCDHRYIRHAEKQTDVNIASQLLRDAYEERVEKAYIISRDSDLIPAIRLLKEMRVRTMVVFPPKTQEVEELKRVCGQHRLLKDKDIENALLPVEYSLKTGEVVSRPDNWS